MSTLWDLPSAETLLRNLETAGTPSVCREARDTFLGAEASLLFAVVKAYQPARLVEIGCGWTTMIMASAMLPTSTLTTFALGPWGPMPTGDPRWEYVTGEARTTYDAREMDFLLLDAEHSPEFAVWCQETVLPHLPLGCPLMVHDWLPGRPEAWNTPEAMAWEAWLGAHPEYRIWYAFGRDAPQLGLSSVWLARI